MYGGLHYDESGPQAAETQNRAGSVFEVCNIADPNLVWMLGSELALQQVLFFVLLLLSMLAAYISNQVAISSKRAELQTLQEQISQQQTKNEEMQRILSGDSDEVTEWVARDSYNYAAANERIFVDVTGN